MSFPAVRSVYKINSNAFQNYCRFFSYKFEMTPATRISAESQEDKSFHGVAEEQIDVNPRTSPVERPSTAGDVVAAQKETVKAAIEQQQLQPAMLPEYFQKQMERNALINPEPEPNEEDRINNGHNPINPRRFQVSKTYANAILPLKSVKLANPFPEPVKMMMSRTVSDDEKAEQMLAEARSQRNVSAFGKISANPPYRSFSTVIKRWYAIDSLGDDKEKCPKFGQKKGTGCPRLKYDNCPLPARVRCDRLAKNIDCKKQEAPYPAYSEFCHEDIDEKPSECKICPWKPEENPNFKPQKKNIHTVMYPLAMKRSGLEMDRSDYPTAEGNTVKGMQCDLRKPECERPKNRRCPPTEKEKKAKKEEKKKKKPEKECQGVRSIADLLEPEEILTQTIVQDNLKSLKKKEKKEQGPCKVKRFKFPKCDETRKKEEIRHTGRCPTKKKHPLIEDCPPSGEEKCSQALEFDVIEEYSFSEEKKIKCPKIDMTINKPEVEEDPCNLRKKGITKICPGDLLKKKRKKPRKDASSVITPVEPKTEPPQPVIRPM